MKHLLWIVLVLMSSQVTAAPIDELTALGLPKETAHTILDRWISRHPDQNPADLIAVIRQAANNGAPVSLMVDKAAEGLAKGVPLPRLVRVLSEWSANLAQATHTVRQMRKNREDNNVSEREAVLRLSMLQRIQQDQTWLDRLKEEAQKNKIDLQSFLNASEAVGHLTNGLGLKKPEAEQLGSLWMNQRVSLGDIAKHIRAIEISRDTMPVTQAARLVVENIMGGASPDDILRGIQNKYADKDKRDLRDNPSVGIETDDQKGEVEAGRSSENRSNRRDKDKKDNASNRKDSDG